VTTRSAFGAEGDRRFEGGVVVVERRARRHQQPPFHQLAVAELDLPDLEVLGHGQQVPRGDGLDRHGRSSLSAAIVAEQALPPREDDPTR
jgi:hypothetical protein